MAQTYTLEEAADKLGISTDELKRRLKDEWKSIRSFRDGPTLRFRAADVEELARNLGAASDPGLPLAPIAEEVDSDDFKIPGPGPKKSKPAEEPLHLDSGDDDIFSLSSDGSKAGKPKPKGDSDVRVESGKLKKGKTKKDEASVVPTEEISIDFSGPGSAVIKGGSSAKLSAPKSSSKLTSSSDSGKKLSNPNQADSSEFELSLDSDSDDFELQLNADTSDEVALGSMPKDKDPGKRGGESGINLRDPSDAGISLESGKRKAPPKKPDTDSSDDFDLSVEASEGPKSIKLSNPKSGKAPVTSDSDSEFELTLDDSSGGSSLEHAALKDSGEKNDIFETDFEIPPMQDDSGSEAVAVEDTDLEKSGEVELAFDDSDVLAEEETGSQVVLIDDDEGKPAAKSGWKSGTKRPVADVEDLAGVELEEDDDLGGAVARRKRLRDAEEEEEEELATPSGTAKPAEWGALPAIILFPALIFTLLGGLMGFELLRTMWGYQQPRQPAAPLVKLMAEKLDMDVKDQ